MVGPHLGWGAQKGPYFGWELRLLCGRCGVTTIPGGFQEQWRCGSLVGNGVDGLMVRLDDLFQP